MRQVLVPPATVSEAAPDPALEASLDGIDPETAAVLLVHLAGDALHQERQPGEARFCSTAESLAMEMNANNLFNDRDDNGDLLARYRMLWLDYGTRLKRYTSRLLPADMLREAAGIGFDEMTALASAYWGYLQMRGPGDPVGVNVAMAAPAMTIPPADVETFLGLFSSTPVALAAELRQCPQPWQMRPLHARPLLRLGDVVVVLDDRYLIERVTRAQGRVGGGPPGDAWVDQRAADVDDSGQTGVAGDRQMPEMAAGHDLGCVMDAGRRVDDRRPDGHQLTDPDLVEVFAVRGRVGNISLGEDASGWPVTASRTMRAVALACFIR
jgi:hypothetical protein